MTRGGVEGLEGVATARVLYLNDCGQHEIQGHFTDIIYVNVNSLLCAISGDSQFDYLSA
jgi:hypothetical protein